MGAGHGACQKASMSRGLIGAVLWLALSGCVAVRPWQRERLASPAMAAVSDEPVTAEYRAKVIESRTGGGVPGGTPGGGCGCTQ
jgi:hypothetical protein